ncbi:hypothetical protein FRB96_001327 [Tulasnella sp. 330]|nr:hypothetical protein FRB96_001327 [Tulasnella sp. 330]KAG8880429.1 hypothetical protein FRB97_000793 [Tulasnella sp. 331]KAG8888379.1 hypothetical protein FRB98_007774 [Tulasnella sp. 332]
MSGSQLNTSSTASSLEASIMTNQKIIIALVVVCVALLCIVMFLVVRYRKPRSFTRLRGNVLRMEDAEAAAGIRTRSRATPSLRTMGSANGSWEVIEAPRTATPRDRAEDMRTDDDGSVKLVGPERRPVSAARSGSRILSSAWTKTLNLGGYTDIHRPRSAIVRSSNTIDRPKTPRAASFPASLPSPRYPPSPEAAYSLTQQSSNQPLLPNISPIRHHRRVPTLPGDISPPLHSPLPGMTYPPSPAIEVHSGSPTPDATLPPSPPPSPEPGITYEGEVGVVELRRVSTGTMPQPSTTGTHSRSHSAHRVSIRQGTAGTAVSSSAPSISTLSGSSGRFSNLFFAPLSTSPPRQSIIVEDIDFNPSRSQRPSSGPS